MHNSLQRMGNKKPRKFSRKRLSGCQRRKLAKERDRIAREVVLSRSGDHITSMTGLTIAQTELEPASNLHRSSLHPIAQSNASIEKKIEPPPKDKPMARAGFDAKNPIEDISRAAGKPDLLETLDKWLDAQSQGVRDPKYFFRAWRNNVEKAGSIKVIVSAGTSGRFRTTCSLPVAHCKTLTKLLKHTWEKISKEVQESIGEEYKWWDAVVLIKQLSMERNSRLKLLAMHREHDKLFSEWYERCVSRGYLNSDIVGVAYGVAKARAVD